MTTIEILRAARERISDPARWWDGRSLYGAQLCAVDAIYEADPDDWRVRNDARRALRDAMPTPTGVAAFNDTHTHAEVLALFDQAIAAAEDR